MWKVFLLIIVVIAIVILLFNSPRTDIPKKETKHKRVHFEEPVTEKEVKLETKKEVFFEPQSPEKEGYIITEKKMFSVGERELHLILYSRNFDAFVKGYWKHKDNWETIPMLSANVRTNNLPEFKFLHFDGEYLYHYLGPFVFSYYYDSLKKDFKLILNQMDKLPFFPVVTSLEIKNNQVIISGDAKYQIANYKISQQIKF